MKMYYALKTKYWLEDVHEILLNDVYYSKTKKNAEYP